MLVGWLVVGQEWVWWSHHEHSYLRGTWFLKWRPVPHISINSFIVRWLLYFPLQSRRFELSQAFEINVAINTTLLVMPWSVHLANLFLFLLYRHSPTLKREREMSRQAGHTNYHTYFFAHLSHFISFLTPCNDKSLHDYDSCMIRKTWWTLLFLFV